MIRKLFFFAVTLTVLISVGCKKTNTDIEKKQEQEEVMAFRIITNIVGELGTNCYLVYKENDKGRKAIIIDPGDDASIILKMCEDNNLKPEAILLTHHHFDHIMAANAVRDAYQIPLYTCIDEKELFGTELFGITATINMEGVNWISGDDILELAGFTIKVLHTPGHTSGGVCYYIEEENVLFSGDTIFFETYGRTDFPTGDLQILFQSFKEKLFILPDETAVYPGHGEKTTIAHEKKYNYIFYSIGNDR